MRKILLLSLFTTTFASEMLASPSPDAELDPFFWCAERPAVAKPDADPACKPGGDCAAYLAL